MKINSTGHGNNEKYALQEKLSAWACGFCEGDYTPKARACWKVKT